MLRDLLWGLKWGFWFALFFSFVAVAMTLFTGGEIIERQRISLTASIAIYVFGGFSGGIVLGLLRPLTKYRIGAALVGIVVMTPASILLGLTLFGPPHDWSRDMTVTVILLPMVLGGPGGYLYWEPRGEERE
jgi:O-antigen/teichoic acid export membrane protein